VNKHPEIKRLEDIKLNYKFIHNRYVYLKGLRRISPIKFEKELTSWKNINTVSDIQNFVDSNKIKSSAELRSKYPGLITKAKNINVDVFRDIIYPKKELSEYDLVTIEEANDFVKENNIKSMSELRRKYHDKYLLFKNVRDKLNYTGYPNWKSFNSLKSIQDYIDDNNIKSKKQFKEVVPGLYSRSLVKGFFKDLVFKEEPAFIKYKIKDRFKTIDDIQKYIIDNNISKHGILISTEEGKSIESYARVRGWKIEYPNGPNDYSGFKTLEDFQNYINENDIQSPSEFKKKSNGIYSKSVKLGFHKSLIYTAPRGSSYLEIKVKKKLIELGIEFETEYTFSDLKDKNKLRLDFYIKSKNLIIEPGGIQHLTPTRRVNGENYETLRRHD